MIGIDDPELRRDACVEDTQFFCLHDFQQSRCYRFIDDELHLDNHAAGQFEESVLVEHVAPTEASDGTKRRAATDTKLTRFFEEPLPEQHVLMTMSFLDIKS